MFKSFSYTLLPEKQHLQIPPGGAPSPAQSGPAVPRLSPAQLSPTVPIPCPHCPQTVPSPAQSCCPHPGAIPAVPIPCPQPSSVPLSPSLVPSCPLSPARASPAVP
ncbi:PREDICTED: vegetative cell wall protein gp1-like [Nipponia nippon]|uniref:vegetative cell wall protein gp1-like n=1 Tax=Nipponia nippon TaxID=128390 RepID=UPI000510971B|nr:PREDICTED: vegetative cell wall protein gp1-like [Nipponia nippon]